MKIHNIINRAILLDIIFFVCIPCYSLDFNQLLKGYTESNITLQKLKISLEQTRLALQRTKIENGISLTLSTGTVKFTTDEISITDGPTVSVSIPSINDTSFTISTPIKIDTDGELNPSLENAGISVKTDIVSPKKLENKIDLEKAERAVYEANQKIYYQQLTLKNEFLQILKKLCTYQKEMLENQDTLVTKQIDFEAVKAKGYYTTSAKYRTSALALKTAQREYDESVRLYQAEMLLFLTNCGVNSENIPTTSEEYNNLLLDFTLPHEELIDIHIFNAEKYRKTETEVWTNYINSLNRSTKSDFTLSASGGLSSSGDFTSLGDNKVNASLQTEYKNVGLSLGVSIPISDNINPAISFSLSWNPSASKLDDITEKENINQNQLEKLAITDTEVDFNISITEYDTKKKNLEWQYLCNIDESELYRELKNDNENWYKEGLVSSSEYRKAVINYENAKTVFNLTLIEQLIYNTEVLSLFIQE